jgi:hypothetical protein
LLVEVRRVERSVLCSGRTYAQKGAILLKRLHGCFPSEFSDPNSGKHISPVDFVLGSRKFVITKMKEVDPYFVLNLKDNPARAGVAMRTFFLESYSKKKVRDVLLTLKEVSFRCVGGWWSAQVRHM